MTWLYSLRTRLILFFLLLGLVPMLVITTLSYHKASEALLKSTGQSLAAIAANGIHTIEAILSERYGDVQVFAGNLAASSGDLAPLQKSIDSYMSLYSSYDLMLVLDNKGKVLCSNTVDHTGSGIARSGLIGRNLADQRFFQACAFGALAPGESYHEELARYAEVEELLGQAVPSLLFAAPVYDETGEILRVWVNFASWSRIAGDIIDDIDNRMIAAGYSSVETQILRQDGTILYDADHSAVLEINLLDAGMQAAQSVAQGQNGYVVEEHKHRLVNQVNGYASSRGFKDHKLYDWGMLVRIDQDEALLAAEQLRSQNQWMTLLMALGIILLAFVLANSIAGPLLRMAAVLKSVAQGDLEHTFKNNSRSELGAMAKAIAETVDHLREGDQLKEAQAERQQELLRINSMVANASLSMIYVNKDYLVKFANPAAITMMEMSLGFEHDIWRNCKIAETFPQGEFLLSKIVDPNHRSWRGILAVDDLKLEFSMSEIRDAEDANIGASITIEDVTQKLLIEEQIQQDAERQQREAAEIQQKVDRIKEVVQHVVNGDLSQALDSDGDDAISTVCQVLNMLFESLREVFGVIRINVGQLKEAGSMLSEVSNGMSETAEGTSRQAGEVASTSQQITMTMETSACGAEEMGASIREISRNTAEAARVAADAVRLASDTSTQMGTLNNSSSEIGEVIKVITSIAEQTNLLALNATIEAARAGEAGKGFAVVANEVKELAKETANATENISRKVVSIQEKTGRAVHSIDEIQGIIHKINDLQNAIASAIEEQSATTSEISRSVHEAANGSKAISNGIESLTDAAQATSKGANDTYRAVEHLDRVTGDLNVVVERFKVNG